MEEKIIVVSKEDQMFFKMVRLDIDTINYSKQTCMNSYTSKHW